MGLKKIWNIIRGFQSRHTPNAANINNDPNSDEIKKLQNDLVNPDISLSYISNIEDVDETDPMNQSFSKEEFFHALNFCKKDSAPGLDSFSYKIIKKTPYLNKTVPSTNP